MSTPTPERQRVRVRRRRKQSRFKSRAFALAAALTSAALIAVGAFAVFSQQTARPNRSQADHVAYQAPEPDAQLTRAASNGRPVYRHSVIPGGVFTAEELRDALAEDAVAAAHYRSVDAPTLRPEVVKHERFAYVSYRKDNQIYWTRNKVRIAAGETILTDGNNEIRARCGNCISDTPKFPVADADVEPDVAELDRLVEDDAAQPFLTAAIRSALDSPAGFGPGGIPGSPAGGGPGAPGIGPGGLGGTGFGPAGFPVPRGGSGGPGGSDVAAGSGGSGPSEAYPPASIPKSDEGDPNGSPNDPNDPDGPDGPGGPGDAGGPGEPGGPGGPGGPGDPGSPGGPGGPGGPGDPWIPPGIVPPPGYENPPSGGNPPGNPPGPGGPTDNPTGKQVPTETQSVPEPGLIILMGGGAAVALLRRRTRR